MKGIILCSFNHYLKRLRKMRLIPGSKGTYTFSVLLNALPTLATLAGDRLLKVTVSSQKREIL